MLFPAADTLVPRDYFPLPTDDRHHPLAVAFRDFIRAASFPCVGAKSALGKGDLRIVIAREISSDDEDARIHAALLAFIANYRLRPDLFQSFAVIFEPAAMSEHEFEARLWERLQSLSDRDGSLGHPWDGRVAPDPSNPHFSLSFAREAFFVVGLHPGASRPARRFQAPVLVFNLHDQFERLRAEGRYEKLRDSILRRDLALAGTTNPMLSRHGDLSEARQYSGRAVDDDWACPFRAVAKQNA
jgi:uncharacterized protein